MLKNPLIFIAVFSLGFFILNESSSYYNGLEEAKAASYKKDKLILQNLTDSQSKNVQILAEVLAVNPGVIEGYLKNDPEIIKKSVYPLWEKVKNEKLTHEIHFFKPPAISFVNFSNFESLGDDVSDVRTDIAWITSSFKPSAHALMCKTYAGYRATHPIFDENGTILGGLSLGKKIDWIPKALKETTEHDSFLVYVKAAVSSLAPKYHEAFMKDKQLIGNYVLADRTLSVTEKEVQGVDFDKRIQSIVIGEVSYTLYAYPIIDFNKKTIGYVCTVTQLKQFKDHFISNLLKSFILIIISILIILLITRSKILELFREIKYIQDMTKKIKNRDFSLLHTKKVNSSLSTDTLVKLEHDVMEMGLELEKHYVLLEDDNREKSLQLIEQLYMDELTGLSNRNALVKDLQSNTNSYLAIFNIRNFKEINDAFGFEMGDYILKELAMKYNKTATTREGCCAYRIASDEYVLMESKNTSKSDFEDLVEKMIYEIEHMHFQVKDENVDISINVYAGICFDSTKKLEKSAMALTQAKQDKKELVIYTKKKNMKNVQLNNLETINKLIKAFRNDGMIVHYQAIVDRNQNIHKYEALIRMRDQDKILSPYFFLELSKRTKHYSRITQFVLENVFEQFKSTDCALSINLTADDILNADTISLIKEKINLCAHPERVIFELVESDDLYNIPEMHDFIQYVKKVGAKIAIDDFGTGYSNFSYMMTIKPDYLKIDGSLIKNLDTDKNAVKIVKTIINFASQLGIKTIAEYVHSKDIFEICRDLGIDEFQGYYFSEPAEL